MFEAVLGLNNTHAAQLSELDAPKLRRLLGQAFHLDVIEEADAFLLAFDQSAEYDSPNYAWVRSRYDRFAYTDRLVVAPARRGQGLARRMYARLFDVARDAGHGVVLCEVNQVPPNPASDALHAALGFRPVGTAQVETRVVQYLARTL